MTNHARNHDREDEIASEVPEVSGAVYVMSVAAELVGTHPQTLREYERRGFITPHRTTGGNRRYTTQDIQTVLRIKKMRDDGMSLTAIASLMEYEEAIYVLQEENALLKDELVATQHRLGDVEHRLYDVESTLTSTALVPASSRDMVLHSPKNTQDQPEADDEE